MYFPVKGYWKTIILTFPNTLTRQQVEDLRYAVSWVNFFNIKKRFLGSIVDLKKAIKIWNPRY